MPEDIMNSLELFCRQIYSRSEENCASIRVLLKERLYGNALSVLRQELDSLIRVLYLLSIEDIKFRRELIEASIQGKLWKTKEGKLITDREMVNQANKMHGWAKSVYKFGCAFIHLSKYHDYMNRDLFQIMTKEERNDVKQHIEHFNQVTLKEDFTLNDIVPFLDKVFDKVSVNLECHLEDLKKEGNLRN
jgi:hypothetical protein